MKMSIIKDYVKLNRSSGAYHIGFFHNNSDKDEEGEWMILNIW